MIPARLVAGLGLSQLICWGVSYYLIGVFGQDIARDLGWSATLTYSGFSGALVMMGLTSGLVGRLIDRHGGRRVMTAGSILLAAGCLVLSQAREVIVYGLAWACLGLAMRMTLYDAAFAALARIAGGAAKTAIAQVTLLGGLASTAFWPIGHALASQLGWRGALVAYAGFALLTLPLHRAIPDRRRDQNAQDDTSETAPLANGRVERLLAGGLYLVIMTIAGFLNSGLSAHMINIISGLGVGAALAVWLSTLRGIGQSTARLCEVLFGRRLSPLALGIIATGILPVSFAAGLFSGVWTLAGGVFALGYGAGNGLLTIVRGAQPLVLFDNRTYGHTAGRLLAPGFYVGALAPVAYATVIDRYGNAAALYLSVALATVAVACALGLWWRFRGRWRPPW